VVVVVVVVVVVGAIGDTETGDASPGDARTGEARPGDANLDTTVGGTITGAERRWTLAGSWRITPSGVEGSVPAPARANPPSPTPAIVPAAAAIFQLMGACLLIGRISSALGFGLRTAWPGQVGGA
jgi:hypothetical protein